MALTPEGKVKKAIKEILSAYGAYYFMPVQNGYGAATVDFLGCYYGKFFAIEAKAKGKAPTPRQLKVIEDMNRAKAKVFVVSDDKSLRVLAAWLQGLID